MLPAACLILVSTAGLSGGSAVIGARQLPSGLEPIIRTYTQRTAQTLDALKKGVDRYLQGQYAEALASLAEASPDEFSQVGDYVLLYRANAHLQLGQGEQALATFRLLQSRYSASPQLQEAILGECQALLLLQHAPEVLAVLKNPRLEENGESLYFRARALEDSGRRGDAISLYLRLIARYVNAKTAGPAEERLGALSPQYWTRPANYLALLERADNLLRAGRNTDARTLLAKLANVAAVDATAAARRRVLHSQAEYNLGKAATVLPVLRKIPESMPELHAQATWLEAVCHRRLEREIPFFEARDRALRLHPQSPFTEKLLFATASYFEVKNRPEEARAAYRELAVRFPRGEHAERAILRAAFLAFFLKQYGDALREFQYCLTALPPSRPPALLYWTGRCYQSLGDRAAAVELFDCARTLAGSSYYGMRARAATSAPEPAGLSRTSPSISGDLRETMRKLVAGHQLEMSFPPPPPATAQAIERARQLATAGLVDLALADLRWSGRQFPEDRSIKYVMSRIYEMKGDYLGVIATLRRAFPEYETRSRGFLPQEIWGLLFPLRYYDEITAQTTRYSLDPNLVLGLIRQESAFDVDARSHANARGLMQIRPATGRRLARQAAMPKYSTQKLFRPDINIALGSRYLASLLQQYDRRVELALAAYNAGEDRVERWLKNFGDIDMAEFVELIPFSETRDYVKQVITNAAFYRQRTAPPNGVSE